jgi:hypothetical protein
MNVQNCTLGVEHLYGVPDPDAAPLLAMVIRGVTKVIPDGVRFLTHQKEQIQVGTIRHPPGYVVKAHQHPQTARYVTGTPEVLLVLKGSCLVELYHPVPEPPVPGTVVPVTLTQGRVTARVTLRESDLIVLLCGGHGFKVGPDGLEMLEVRQGPYVGSNDKVRFKDECPHGAKGGPSNCRLCSGQVGG